MTAIQVSPIEESGAAHSIGIDIGGTNIRIVCFDAAGSAVASAHSTTPFGANALVDHLCDSLAPLVDPGIGRPTSVGIGIPGIVRDGTVAMALNVGIDQPVELAGIVGERLGVPVHVENDVNAAALGAHASLAHSDASTLVYMSLGTGLAAGSVVAGELVRGARGLAGEIGHIPLPGRDTSCPCGQRGCLETIISGRAITERMAAEGLVGDATAMWRAADAGTTVAVELRDDLVTGLAWACQSIVLLLDADRIVIGGGVGISLGDLLLERVRDVIGDRVAGSRFLSSAAIGPRISVASPDVELGALGADRAARRAVGTGAVVTP